MPVEWNDYISALEKQRNDALNEVVNLKAEVAALRRENDRLQDDSTTGGETGKS
jgi:FtsZ-binding cell division protein ZapB